MAVRSPPPASGPPGLDELLDTIEEGFVAYDRDWRVTYLNRAARQALAALGGEDAVAPDRVLWDGFPALIGTALEAHLRAAMAADGPREFEERSPLSGRWLAFRAFPSPGGMTLAFHDVTARRQAIDALRASEAQLRALIDHSADGILLTAPTGEVLSANPAACRMLGRTEDEIRAAGRDGFVDAADPHVPAALERRARDGHASGEVTLVRGDGSRFPAFFHSTLFVDADGHQRSSLSFRDLTAQRRADADREQTLRALRDSEELFRLGFEHAAVGKALVGLDGRFLRVNERLCEIVGYSQAALMELRFHDITHPDDLGSDLALLDALVRGQIPRYELAKRYVCRDGSYVDTRLDVSLLRSKTGEPLFFISQIQDVTEQRRLESRLALADRMTSMGTLAGGIAHEINNPLAAVISNLDVAGEELARLGEAPELAHALAEVRDGAERVRAIVRGMQSFVRAEKEQRVALDLHAVLDTAIAVTANEVRHRAQLVKEYGAIPRVEADEPRLTQVVLNLLVNAAEAIPAGRAQSNTIRVRTARDAQGRAVLDIEDTGRGMSRRVLARAFDPFFTTKEVGAGVGLGLSIAHAVVTSLGGTIEAFSEPDRGARVRIVLPAARSGAAAGPSSRVPVVAPRQRRGRVLVIDDDTRVAAVFARILRHEHDTAVVHSGADAIARLHAGERFDVILCDVMMPEMAGPDVHAAIERLAPEQATKMVFITGGAFMPGARSFLDEVPNPRLEKPVDAPTLRALVRTML